MLPMIRALFSRLRHLGCRSRAEASLSDELKFHLEMETEENLRGGMPPEEARRRALVALGGVEQVKEAGREAWALRWLSNLAKDLRYAFRTYRKNPGFVAVVVLTLALGIGANVVLFTALNALLRPPATVRDPARLVELQLQKQDVTRAFLYSEYIALRDNQTVLQGLAANTYADVASPYGVMQGVLASGNYFAVLGGGMALGRAFSANEIDPVIVLSYSAWGRYFGKDRGFLGQAVQLAGTQFTVIGVASASFGGLGPTVPDFWAPLTAFPVLRGGSIEQGLDGPRLRVVGRLPEGASAEQATAALSALARNMQWPEPILGIRLESQENSNRLVAKEQVDKVSLPMAIAFGLVLLIACANVANVLLARSAARRREIGVRLALGASRARLVQQLLTESTILALAGGLLSLLLARWAAQWAFTATLGALRAGAKSVFFNAELSLDLSAYLYALLVSLITSLAFGLAPALESTGGNLAATMQGGRAALFSKGQRTAPRDRLVVLELAACVVLLISAGLMLRSVLKAGTYDPGFQPAGVAKIRITSRVRASSLKPDPNYRLLAERLRQVPNVDAVSLGHQLAWVIDVTDVAVNDPAKSWRTRFKFVTPDFFRVLRLPLVKGRQFTEAEIASEAPVAIVSETTASLFWPGQNPIGQQVEIVDRKHTRGGRSPRRGLVEVVAVAGDLSLPPSRQPLIDLIEQQTPACLYLPTRRDDSSLGSPLDSLLVRYRGDFNTAARTFRAELAAVDPVAVLEVEPLTEQLRAYLRPLRWMLTIAASLGLLGLLLASIGVYGIMSYAVVQRTQEIGVRVAMGARRRNVLWLILGRSLRLAGVGAAMGIVLAAALSRTLAARVQQVDAYDPLTFAAVPVLLICICLAAAYIPARRATRLDPLVALRQE